MPLDLDEFLIDVVLQESSERQVEVVRSCVQFAMVWPLQGIQNWDTLGPSPTEGSTHVNPTSISTRIIHRSFKGIHPLSQRAFPQPVRSKGYFCDEDNTIEHVSPERDKGRWRGRGLRKSASVRCARHRTYRTTTKEEKEKKKNRHVQPNTV